MRVGIIGTGRIASGLAGRLVKAGHEVMIGSRDAGKAADAAMRSGGQGGAQADAISFGEIIILAVPFTAVTELSQTLPDLDGKIILETTNDLQTYGAGSSTERIQALFPAARVVKAFNHVFAQIIANDPARDLERSTAFIAGEDAAAKARVTELIESIGFDVVDAGGLKNAAHLDNLARFIIDLGYGQGLGTNIAFKLVKVVAE